MSKIIINDKPVYNKTAEKKPELTNEDVLSAEAVCTEGIVKMGAIAEYLEVIIVTFFQDNAKGVLLPKAKIILVDPFGSKEKLKAEFVFPDNFIDNDLFKLWATFMALNTIGRISKRITDIGSEKNMVAIKSVLDKIPKDL